MVAPTMVIDAKYRTRLGRAPTIASDDLYESLAFEVATGSTEVLLLYPRIASADDVYEPGTVDVFSRIAIENKVIIGATVEVRGIGVRGGFSMFTQNLVDGLLLVFPRLAMGVAVGAA